MKKKHLSCLIILLMLFLSGCADKNEGSNESVNRFIGYVVKKEDERILVTNYNKKTAINDAIWVSTNQHIEIGNKVSIIFDGGIDTSNPAQGLAEEIEILESEHPGSPKLNEREVIEVCLNGLKDMSVPVIKSVSYSEEKNLWTIIVIDDKDEDKEESVAEIQELKT